MKWTIFYDDESVYRSSDGPLAGAPGAGVLAIAQEDPALGQHVACGKDWYIYDADKGGWNGTDYVGLARYLDKVRKPVEKICMGMFTDNRTYDKLIRRISEDVNMRNKSANRVGEKPV